MLSQRINLAGERLRRFLLLCLKYSALDNQVQDNSTSFPVQFLGTANRRSHIELKKKLQWKRNRIDCLALQEFVELYVQLHLQSWGGTSVTERMNNKMTLAVMYGDFR